MHNALLVRRGQPARNLRPVINSLAYRKTTMLDLLSQSLAFEQLANHIWRGFVGAHLEHRKNVGMVERCGRARLLLEAPQSIGIPGEKGRQYFDRHIAPKTRIARAINLAH